MQNFPTTDIHEIRRTSRERIESGAITNSYKANLVTVINILNEALATEIVCALRYRRHYFMAKGIHSQPVAEEFLEHSNQEFDHADSLAKRITQLGGQPNFNPKGILERSHIEYIEGNTLMEMIEEDLIAERIAINTYSEIIRYLGNNDITTRRVIEEILAVEEEHADDLVTLVQHIAAIEPIKKTA